MHFQDGDRNGTTRFLRYPDFQSSLIRNLKKSSGEKPVRILVAPGSVGCEAYTYAMLAENIGFPNLSIDSIDVSEEFTSRARTAVYFDTVLPFAAEDFRQHFKASSKDGFIKVSDTIKERVNVLPATDILDFEPAELYDAVIALNLFQHIRWQDNFNGGVLELDLITGIVKKLCAFSNRLVCVNRLENTPFLFHNQLAPDNPFLHDNFAVLDADYQAIAADRLNEFTVYEAIKNRNEVHIMGRDCAL